MAAVTTFNSEPEWNFSYSKLNNFETCPKRCWHIDINKDVKEPESEQLEEGNAVHKAMELRVSQGKPLPERMKDYEPWALKVLAGNAKVLVEQKLAIRRDMSSCGYHDRKVWYRAKGDVIKLMEQSGVGLIIDWKTGKIKEDETQLALMAQCVFSAYPRIQQVRAMFVWLGNDAETTMDFKRGQMQAQWANILPRVNAFEAHHKAMNFPPTPNYLCKRWCSVTQCPHSGT